MKVRPQTIQALEDALRLTRNAGSFRPATPADIKRVEEAGFPPELIEFDTLAMNRLQIASNLRNGSGA